jgi:hypothetical protein
MTGTVLDLQCPKSGISQSAIVSTWGSRCFKPHLHCDESVIDENFLREEVSSDGSLVASAELLVDLVISENFMLALVGIGDRLRHSCRALGGKAERTYWFIKLVFPTPLSPRMITCNTKAPSQ